MDRKEKDVVVFHLRLLLNTVGIKASEIQSDDTYIIMTLSKYPTLELVEKVKKFLFHTDELKVENIDSLVYAAGDKLYVQHKHMTQFEEVFKALKMLKRIPFACAFKPDAINFSYSRNQPTLDFDQLMIIQDFINPGRILTDNLFVIGMFNEYTMYVKVPKSEAA